jgi:hypothetical protein
MADTFKDFLQLNELLGGALPGAFSASVLGAVQTATGAEEAEKVSKFDQSRSIVKSMLDKNPREDIIAHLESKLGIKHSTATTYYERISKELGRSTKTEMTTGKNIGDSEDVTDDKFTADEDAGQRDNAQDDETGAGPDEELDINNEIPQSDDPNKQGILRAIDNAHLIYKRENAEGTFDELWIYSVDSSMENELNIRRNILAGTDIPPKKSKSDDGNQSYTLTTMGNAQILNILNLPQ